VPTELRKASRARADRFGTLYTRRPLAEATLRLLEPQSLSAPDDLKSRQPDQNLCSPAAFQDRSDRHAHKRARNSNLPAAPCTSHQPLSEPDESKSRHPDQNLCSPGACLPRSFRISMSCVGIPPFPRILGQRHLGRRLGTPFDSLDRGIAREGFKLRAAKLY
jgi:hypothetical protein